MKNLSLKDIAKIIKNDWKNISFAAQPYVDALSDLNSIDDYYGCDDGKSIVMHFLCNANLWKGILAREIKNELKRRMGI